MSKNRPTVQQKDTARSDIQAIQISHVSTGPLPAPIELGHYDQVLPGLAERIVRMSENEQRSRLRIESRRLFFVFYARTLMFFIVIFMTSVGGYLVYMGKEFAGSFVSMVPYVLLAIQEFHKSKADRN